MPRAPACPFYGGTHKERIVCLRDGAGTMGRGELRMDFPSQVCRLQYWMKHCCGDWEACSLSPALAVEYELHGDDKPSEVCHNIAKGAIKSSPPVSRRSEVKRGMPAPKRRNYNKWLTLTGLRKIEDYARKGWDNERIAKACGCCLATLQNWTRKYPEFAEALTRGRQSQ